jgi:pyrroline-5-carboxylate reductase
MPNTPMLVGEGISAIARGAHAGAEDLATAREIFESAGLVIDVSEYKMNAVTALSGSGPAYFFYVVEQMIRAGTEMGLTLDEARILASKTALGAATMLAKSDESPQELRRKVTSPGGTTQAALEVMESRQVAPAIVDAIKAAERRGRELGQ